MSEPTRPSASVPGAAGEPDEEPFTGAPRWVKVLGIVTLALAVLLVVAMFAGGGNHGPGRHLPAGGGSDAPTSAPADDVRPEAGHAP